VVRMYAVKLRPTVVFKQELIFVFFFFLRMDSDYHQSRVVPHTCMVREFFLGGGRGKTKELGSQVFF
jgi:hypothetical protein